MKYLWNDACPEDGVDRFNMTGDTSSIRASSLTASDKIFVAENEGVKSTEEFEPTFMNTTCVHNPIHNTYPTIGNADNMAVRARGRETHIAETSTQRHTGSKQGQMRKHKNRKVAGFKPRGRRGMR